MHLQQVLGGRGLSICETILPDDSFGLLPVNLYSAAKDRQTQREWGMGGCTEGEMKREGDCEKRARDEKKRKVENKRLTRYNKRQK